MPSIGNPNENNANRFGQVKIHRRSVEYPKKAKEELGDELNKISGRGATRRFVDKKTHNILGKDGFLKLLSHQLANQDPLTPMDQKRFAADLAQFSQLEQLANINSKMEKTEKNVPAQNKFYGASFIGKRILTEGTTINYQEGNRPILPFYLSQGARKAIVRIYDQSNTMIRQLEIDNLSKGGQSVEWDGLGGDLAPAVNGTYRFDVTAFDKDYNKFKGKTRVDGVVTGVDFENGETILLIDGGKKVFLRDVKQFQITDSAARVNSAEHLKKVAKEAYTNKVE